MDEVMEVKIIRNKKEMKLRAKVIGHPFETDDNAEVIYDQAPYRGGLLRVIVNKPRKEGKMPAMLFIPGYTCNSIDNQTDRPTLLLAPQGSNLVCLPFPVQAYTYLNCATGNNLPINSFNTANPVNNPTGQWVFTVASGGTSVGIQITLPNGCTHRVCTTINYSGKPGRDIIERFERRPGLPATFGKIYPNPSDGEFEIELFNGTDKTNGRALIVDAKGQVLQTLVLSSGHNKIKEKFVPGVYSVITFVDGKEYYDRLVIR